MKLRLLVSLLVMFFVSTAMADTVVLKSDEWCPYNCKPGSDKEGFVIDIVREIFKEAGLELKYEVMTWDKAVEEAEAGGNNGVIGGDESDAPGFIFPKEPIAINSVCFYSKKSADPSKAWKFKGIDSLKEVGKVGVIDGYSYYDEVDEFIESAPKNLVKIKGKEAGKDLASRLVRGMLDVVIENEFVAPHIFGKEMENVEISGCGGVMDLYVALSPHESKKAKSEELAKLITDGVQKMRKDGRLKKILDKYGIKDWKK